MPAKPPIAAALGAFACGVVAVQRLPALPAAPGLIALAALIALIALIALARERLRRRGWRRIGEHCLMALAAAAFGFGYAAWRAEVRLSDALPESAEGIDIVVAGVVDDLPQQTPQGARFAFAVERVVQPAIAVPQRISLAWFPSRQTQGSDEPDVPEVHAGERWRLTVRLKRPHGNVNPGGFDVEAWLLENNLRATGYVRDSTSNERVTAFAGRPSDFVQRAREGIRARILAALPDAPYAGVLVALAIGDQRAIPESQWVVFNRTGIAHLVSISGLHVTVFAALAGGLVFMLARRFARLTTRLPARKLAALAGALFAFAYVLLAGAEVPAVRTLLMLWVGACGLWLGRPGTAGVVWLWSLAAVLLWDPWASLAPGFWLSFGAVGLLLYAGGGRIGRPAAVNRRARAWAALCEASRTQWVVTIGLVPGTIALFHQMSLVSALANAVAIPAVTLLIVPLALSGIALPFAFLWICAHALLAWLMQFLEMLAALPAAVWAQHAPPPWTVLVATLGVVWMLAPHGVPGRWLGGIWLLPVFLVLPPRPPAGGFRLTTLDVGQGLSVVVETHGHAMVYDAGPRFGETTDAGGRIVVPYLRAAGIRALDALVVSHQDLDHSGGGASLIAAVPVAALYSSLPVDSAIAAGAAKRGSVWRCEAGQQWTWDGVRFSVLFPPIGQYAIGGIKTNDLSCVIRVDSAYGSALLTGDIEARSEADLLRGDPPLRASDVLVVPHHGSRTSSTLPFVAAVSPQLAIVAVGYRNRFGHPREDIVARYEHAGAAVLRTDRHGAVTVDVGPGVRLVPVAERERAQRYWLDVPVMQGASN